jgi:hypothetical protein
MLDNLRDSASQSPYFQQDEEPIPESGGPVAPPPRRSLDQITGMTPQQRFIIAVMLLVVVCLLGTMAMMVLGKFVVPFF